MIIFAGRELYRKEMYGNQTEASECRSPARPPPRRCRVRLSPPAAKKLPSDSDSESDTDLSTQKGLQKTLQQAARNLAARNLDKDSESDSDFESDTDPRTRKGEKTAALLLAARNLNRRKPLSPSTAAAILDGGNH